MTEITITGDTTDAALAKAIAKALRAGMPLAITGETSADLGAGASAWITALARARVAVTLGLSGEVGARGVALALLADAVALETRQDTRAAEGIHRDALLAVLAVDRMGQIAARAFLIEPCPLRALEGAGALPALPALTAQPAGRVEDPAAVLGPHKPALVVAGELPFDEAIDFAALAHTALAHTALTHANKDAPT